MDVNATNTAAPQIIQVGQKSWEILLGYGVVGVAVIVFAMVIISLYKEIKEERRECKAERKSFDEERVANAKALEAIRAEYEKRYREVLEGYTQQLRQDRTQQYEREDKIRNAFTELLTDLKDGLGERDEALTEMLKKLQERVLGLGGK